MQIYHAVLDRFFGLLNLHNEIIKIGNVQRCCIGYAMHGHKQRHVLSRCCFTFTFCPHLRRSSPSAIGSGTTLLNARVLITFVIVTGVNKLLASLSRSRKCLESDICSCTITNISRQQMVHALLAPVARHPGH